MTSNNQSLHNARNAKNGEFFIVNNEVVVEMLHYIKHLNGKKVYIPNTKMTTELAQNDAFARYFFTSSMMRKFGIKELSYSYYDIVGNFVLITMTDNGVSREVINASDDDTRLFHVCKQIDKVDVVIGNPEGNKLDVLFRHIVLSKKDYILCVHKLFASHAIFYDYFSKGMIKFGYNVPKKFWDVVNQKTVSPTAMWITSFDNGFEPKVVETWYDMNSYSYNKFDNYNAISVDCVKMIPMNCKGVMGVPVTIAPFLNLNQFEIVGFRKDDDGKDLRINGKDTHCRFLIRFRNI